MESLLGVGGGCLIVLVGLVIVGAVTLWLSDSWPGHGGPTPEPTPTPAAVQAPHGR